MKPAICAICGKSSALMKGDWIEFADYTPPSENVIGHPSGLEWFCSDHLNFAKSVTNLSAEDGVKLLKKQFNASGIPPLPQDKKESKLSRLVRIFKNGMT